MLNFDEPPLKLAKLDLDSNHGVREELTQLQNVSECSTHLSISYDCKLQSNTASTADYNQVQQMQIVEENIHHNNDVLDINEPHDIPSLFHQICTNEIKIKLPGPKWDFHQIVEPPMLVFSELELASIPTHGEKKIPIYSKKVRCEILFFIFIMK